MIETFIVHKEWLDNIKSLPIDMQDKIIADFVRYGVGLNLEHSEDPVTQSMVNMLKNRIDYSKTQYEKKVEMSKTAGRKKKVDDNQVYALAREGRSAAEVADILGVSKSAVDHSEGWRQRKQEGFSFQQRSADDGR